MSEIPKTHPRAASLLIRQKLVKGFDAGLVAKEGLLAHGRGEAFDYMLGEKSSVESKKACRAAAAALLYAANPVISVNGNTAALCGKEMVSLAKAFGAKLEVNIFYSSAPTGVSHDFSVDFVESEDFRTLAFNALPGEEGHNPDYTVNSGDDVTFTATNKGVSFHSFGIVPDPADFNNILWGSAIAAPTNPLKAGESDSVTFTAGAPGEYHYICTVPGHAAQGMQGSFTVE